MTPWLRSFLPRSLPYRGTDLARGGLGALVGILVASATAKALDVGAAGVPFIVAPMGASAVLLFAAPASPLAQPWPLLGGNLVSTLVGVLAGRTIHGTALAAALAVGVAITLMMLLRCLHPPGGACALFASVGAPPVHDQGYLFAVFPVAIDTVCLLVVAVLVNNLTGRRYPHVPAPQPERPGLRVEDIRSAIAALDQGLDILPDDVLVLVREAERHALERRLGNLRVESVMRTDVTTVLDHDSVYRVRLIINQQRVKAVPVVDGARRVIGIVTMNDLFALTLANVEQVRTVMTSPVRTVAADAPVSELVALMTEHGVRHVPVVAADGTLAGIVSRTELIEILHRALVEA